MPIIRNLDIINLYGSSHSHEEIPTLESFLNETAPHSLYLEVTPDMVTSRDQLKPDMVFSLEYAERNGIQPRFIGYSVDEVWNQLARRHPLGVVVDKAIHYLNDLVEYIDRLQTNPQYELHITLQETIQRFLGLLPDKEAFTSAMQQYILDLSMEDIVDYIRPNTRTRIFGQVRETINGMDQYIAGLHSRLVTNQPLNALEEEEISYDTEHDTEVDVAVRGPAAIIWGDYKREWLHLTNTIIWRNTSPHIRTDPKPADFVEGFQHLSFTESQIIRLNL
ncbi:MAG: hypothetical protein IH934_06455 [Nanoarchaeota archaeon]|nr:hypothetical protein [Nanoarchaeota archaeon]